MWSLNLPLISELLNLSEFGSISERVFAWSAGAKECQTISESERF
jgi:hypothetical protein